MHTIFDYVLRVLYTGCQWKELPIEKNSDGAAGHPLQPDI